MKNKLTVTEILESKGKRKLAEVYTHNAIEAEACEQAGIEMIIYSLILIIFGTPIYLLKK